MSTHSPKPLIDVYRDHPGPVQRMAFAGKLCDALDEIDGELSTQALIMRSVGNTGGERAINSMQLAMHQLKRGLRDG